MNPSSGLAWILGDLADGVLAGIALEPGFEGRPAVRAEFDRIWPDLEPLREAVRFSVHATTRLLERTGADPLREGTLPEAEPDDEALRAGAVGSPSPEDGSTRALAAFGRIYCLLHPALAPVARRASPDRLVAPVVSAGREIAERSGRPDLSAAWLLERTDRLSALARALGGWVRREEAIARLREGEGAALDEVLLRAFGAGIASEEVVAAARFDEGGGPHSGGGFDRLIAGLGAIGGGGGPEGEASGDGSGPFAPGTVHRALVEDWEGEDLVVSLSHDLAGTRRGVVPPDLWRWSGRSNGGESRPRSGEAIIVEIDAEGSDGDLRVAAVDPWEEFLPEFFREHRGRMLQGRIDEIEDDRLVLRVVDRLFGEPDGIQGDLPGDEMELVYPFPLGVFFRAGDRLPVQVSEVDSQEGRLLLTSPWIDRDPWQEGYVERRYRPGSIEKGTVVRVEAEEILVLLEPGIVGRMPLSPRGRYGLGVPVEVEIVDLAVASRALTLRRVPS